MTRPVGRPGSGTAYAGTGAVLISGGDPVVSAIDANELREAWSDLRLTLEDLGERFGRSGSTMSYHAKRLGLPKRKSGRRPQSVVVASRSPRSHVGVELTGGRWVPNGRGVMVWAVDDGR